MGGGKGAEKNQPEGGMLVRKIAREGPYLVRTDTMTDGQLKVIDSISGGSVLALRAALPEIDRVKLKLSEYRVTVAEDGSSI